MNHSPFINFYESSFSILFFRITSINLIGKSFFDGQLKSLNTFSGEKIIRTLYEKPVFLSDVKKPQNDHLSSN